MILDWHYGIDMSTLSELFAARHARNQRTTEPSAQTLATMSNELGVDTLRYLSVEEVAAAIGVPRGNLCLGCVTARYPTMGASELYARAVDRSTSAASSVRIYAEPE